MNILIIGSGGREHAIAWRCKHDEVENRIFIAPGNAGTERVGTNVNLDVRNFESIRDFSKQENIDLVIVGSEEFLSKGIVDYLTKFGINVFGPNQAAAKIESDKSFAKDFMFRNKIPTAAYQVFFRNQISEALNYLKTIKYPAVIKVAGLAAGKGVIINDNYNDAEKTIIEIFENDKFGESGDKIIIEEFLKGEELSLLVVTDGTKYKILPSAQDHKRIFDNDLGGNTGGMGAYSPAPLADEELLKKIENEIIIPTFDGFEKEKIDYKGCLYFGLMVSDNKDAYVIEYNSRFGDPETQAILPLIKGNFSRFLFSATQGNLAEKEISFSNSCSICVILSSEGYPNEYKKGFEITGLDEFESTADCIVFHSGTKMVNGKLVTNGGRVLGIIKVDRENDLINCKKDVYSAISKINFSGMHFRKDIADKGIKYLIK